MKICITAKGPSLESDVDPRFGRCANFIFLETETMEYESFPNTHAQQSGGAGIKSGQIVSEKGASAVITGNVGPNAYDTLKAGDIQIITGALGSVKEVITQFKEGRLKTADSPTVQSHYGTNE